MKMKKIGPGDASKILLCRSATDLHLNQSAQFVSDSQVSSGLGDIRCFGGGRSIVS